MSEGHETARRETSGTIVDNYQFDSGLEWEGRDLHYSDDSVWICECGAEFESESSLASHMRQMGVPTNKLQFGDAKNKRHQ